jgi:hypothetical protein
MKYFFLIIKGYFRNPKLYIMHYASKVLLLKFIRFYGKSFILKTCSWLYCFDTLILEKITNLVESIWSQNTKVIKQIRRQIEKLQNKKKGNSPTGPAWSQKAQQTSPEQPRSPISSH